MRYLIGLLVCGLLFSCTDVNGSNKEEIKGEEKQALLNAYYAMELPFSDSPVTGSDTVVADEFSVIKSGSTISISRNGVEQTRIEEQGNTRKISFFDAAASSFIALWDDLVDSINDNNTQTENGTTLRATINKKADKITISVVGGKDDAFVIEKSANSATMTADTDSLELL